MDPIKKRKIDENGVVGADSDAFNPLMLTVDDARRILEPFTHDQLLEIVQNALLRHPDVLDAVRLFADRDTTQRKLFIRGLGWETTTEKLRALFSSYGELDEAVVILDKVTGKSKGYGFVTFKHIDGAIMALKEPSKKIDGRMTVTQLAAAGISGGGGAGAAGAAGGVNNPVDVSMRKIYVSNVPYDMPAERLLQHFSMYGEIEEGPLGFDKATGKSKGFALFVYKTAEAARASLVDAIKTIDGHQLNCKLAIDGKRGKPPGVGSVGSMGVQGGNIGNVDGVGAPVPAGQYGGHGGVGGHYGGFSGGLGAGVGGPGLSSIGSQAAGSNHGVSGGFGSGIGGPYGGGSHIGRPIGTGYGGLGSAAGGFNGTGALGGSGSGVGSGAGLVGGGFSGHGAALGGAGGGTGGAAAGRGSSLYGLPPSSAGMVSGEYPQSSHYNLSSGSYQGQHNQLAGAHSAPRIPPGGAYQGIPPYY
ncbi:RNA-binding family protein [Perilla frutescens var. hirtella]|nr:RNA-binding family protein [Perilla frutescens var. frutescens]KAH6775710.1 RNA-binding family protein [Perilla frutescens var. hirtella]KAH6795744.1 hypothetical protein C2S51_036730 [Perilla frutescens var. frutescens]